MSLSHDARDASPPSPRYPHTPHPVTCNPLAWQREADRLTHEIARQRALGNNFAAASLAKTRKFALAQAARV